MKYQWRRYRAVLGESPPAREVWIEIVPSAGELDIGDGVTSREGGVD